MQTLQSLVLPHLDVCTEESLYVRLNERAWAALQPQRLYFQAGGVASTDTYYNGLTVRVWKGLCAVDRLWLELLGEGAFVVTIGLHAVGRSSVWLQEQTVQLTAGSPRRLAVAAWPSLGDGLLFVRLRALDAGVLEAARYLTEEPPPRDVRLGIVVTHFNRAAQVMPALERIGRTVLERPDLQGRVTLCVVDNSRNLPAVSGSGIEVVPNTNFGGTGGFARGLLALMDGARHTHALFMDDDASCEGESIARAYALLQYAREPSQAVAGALLREAAPWHLLEKGARFDHQVRPLCAGLDMRRVDDLLVAERPAQAPDYGAWWFFAFPLSEVRHFPFPFFVRGDDIQFGLANRFRIATLNGVGCFGEDFGVKHGPLTAYLDARYHLVLALLDPPRAARRLRWIATQLFLRPLKTYHYSTARAVTLAFRHVLEGPRFFREHLDLQAVRAEIATWTPTEKLAPLDRSGLDVRATRRPRESAARRLVRALTLQGALLPAAGWKDRTTVVDKDFHGRAAAVFRYRRVLVEHAGSGTGYVLAYDRQRFFGELRAFHAAWRALMRQRAALQRDYADGVAEMTTPAFWRGVYADSPTPAGSSNAGLQSARDEAVGKVLAV